MTGAREAILERLRSAAQPVAAGAAPAVGGRTPVPWQRRAEQFSARACAAAATVLRVPAEGAVPDAIADYLAGLGLPLSVHVSADPPGCGPGAGGRIEWESGPPATDGDTLVSGCLAAVAEEGVVVLASGAGHATESAFLAATHVVVVRAGQMLSSLEDFWPLLRAGGIPPRAVNLILGPSRTADLGVPSRLGAHGPLRVHVILIDEPGAASPVA